MSKYMIQAAVLIWGLSAFAAQSNNQFMKSAKVDLQKDVATLPLHLGHLKDGRKVWFILTDTNSPAEAKARGLVLAPQLQAVLAAKSTRTATIAADGTFTFSAGSVDFSPVRALVPGDAPNAFPPKSFTPGSVADADYSPFVRIEGTNTVFNAPVVAFAVEAGQIAFCNGGVDYALVHDRVMSICPAKMEVSLSLGHGFAAGQPVIYLSVDSNNALPATMEGVTYAPATDDLKNSGASEDLYAFANGATGKDNADRQGFNSALMGEGPPLNILDGLTPASTGYTPVWDINVAVWTDAAIQQNQRHRLTSGEAARSASDKGQVISPMGGKVQSLGLLVNCPVVGFVQE